MVFTVQVHGRALNEILNVSLNGINNINSVLLNDAGQDGDLVPDDGAYSGTLTVDTNGLSPQECLIYKAIAITSTGNFTSPGYELCVTAFPIGFQPSDTSHVVSDPESGEPAIADEVLVGFKAGTSESTMISIAESVNGQIIGSLIELGIYQIKLDTPAATSAELAVILAALAAFPEVEFSESNVIDQDTTVVPSDSKFSDQDGTRMTKHGISQEDM